MLITCGGINYHVAGFVIVLPWESISEGGSKLCWRWQSLILKTRFADWYMSRGVRTQ